MASNQTISSPAALFSFCLQSFPASGSSQMSWLFASGGQSIRSFSFSISPSNEYSELISFRIDWFDLLAVQGTLKSLLQDHNSKASILWHSAFFMVQLTSIHDYWRNHSFDHPDLCWQSDVSAFKYTVSVCHSFSLKEQASLNCVIAVFLPGEFHGQRSLEGYSPWGLKESDMTEQLSTAQSSSTVILDLRK